MELNEIATKADLERMKAEIIDTILRVVQPNDMEALLSISQAAEFLGGMSTQTLRQKTCAGEIASHLAGGLKYSRRDLISYAKSTRRPSNSEIVAKSRMV